MAMVIFSLIGLCSIVSYDDRTLDVKIVIDEHPPLVMGIIPYLTADQLKTQMKPLSDYLSIRLKRSVVLSIAADYESLGKLIDAGRVDFTWFSHSSFLNLSRGKEWEVICRPVVNGAKLYRGMIIVKASSSYQKIEDLKGRNFAYVDRNSGSGFFYPNMYFSRIGIEPLRFFGNIFFSHSHDISVNRVLDGTYDAAAVYADAIKSDQIKAATRVIAMTGWIPNDPIVVRKDIDKRLRAELEDALFNMDTYPEGKILLAELTALKGITKFVSEKDIQSELKGLTDEFK